MQKTVIPAGRVLVHNHVSRQKPIDSIITTVIICIGILAFLVCAATGHSLLFGLIVGFGVPFLLATAWCVFFRAPTTRTRIALGVICIPLYLGYALYIWVAFAKQPPLTP
jgi:hypothetical protein